MQLLVNEPGCIFVMNPTMEILSENYISQFPENMEKADVLSFIQLHGFEDENEYCSYIFLRKNNKTYLYYEYDNPSELTLIRDLKEFSTAQFKDKIKEISNRYFLLLYSYFIAYEEKLKIDSALPTNNTKKQTMKI